VTASTWECHEKSASRWSPNSSNELTRSIWPSVHCMKGKLEDSATGPMTISFVLVKLTAMSLIVDQYSTCWKKFCMLEDLFRPCSNSVSVVSSTYLWAKQLTCRSSISKRNVRGPSHEPWGQGRFYVGARGAQAPQMLARPPKYFGSNSKNTHSWNLGYFCTLAKSTLISVSA